MHFQMDDGPITVVRLAKRLKAPRKDLFLIVLRILVHPKEGLGSNPTPVRSFS